MVILEVVLKGSWAVPMPCVDYIFLYTSRTGTKNYRKVGVNHPPDRFLGGHFRGDFLRKRSIFTPKSSILTAEVKRGSKDPKKAQKWPFLEFSRPPPGKTRKSPAMRGNLRGFFSTFFRKNPIFGVFRGTCHQRGESHCIAHN